jgi:hypothetical protein
MSFLLPHTIPKHENHAKLRALLKGTAFTGAEKTVLLKGTASEPVLSVVERMPTRTASKTPSALPKAGVKAQPQRLNRFPQTPQLHTSTNRIYCLIINHLQRFPQPKP